MMRWAHPCVAVYVGYYAAYVLLGLSDAASTGWLIRSGTAFELNIRVRDPSFSGVMQAHLMVGLMFSAFPNLSLAMMRAPEKIRERFEFYGKINEIAMRVPGAASLWVLTMLIGASVNNCLGILTGMTPVGLMMRRLGYEDEIEVIAAFQMFVLGSILALIYPCYRVFDLASARIVGTLTHAEKRDMHADDESVG